MCIVLAATKQLYEWFSPSVCLSVRPSVTPFSLCSHRCIIMKFSWFITNDRSDVHAKDQDQRSKVKVTEIKPQFSCFRTITPVWIYIWWWNDAHRCCLEEVPYFFSRSSIKFQGHTRQKIATFDRNWAFPDCNSSLNSPMDLKRCTKLDIIKKACPMVFQERSSTKFQGHMGWKVDDLNPIWVRLLGRSQLSNPSDLPCFHWAKFSVNYIDLCQLQN